eukprot:7541301-Alexandrium_andersonii.AAC.1
MHKYVNAVACMRASLATPTAMPPPALARALLFLHSAARKLPAADAPPHLARRPLSEGARPTRILQ